MFSSYPQLKCLSSTTESTLSTPKSSNFSIALSSVSGFNKGEVGCSVITISYSSNANFSFLTIASYTTGSSGTSSLDKSSERLITLAPNFSDSNEISESSVVTTTSSTYSDDFAMPIEYEIKGLLSNNLIFLRGIPLEPPLAGITTKILLLLNITTP